MFGSAAAGGAAADRDDAGAGGGRAGRQRADPAARAGHAARRRAEPAAEDFRRARAKAGWRAESGEAGERHVDRFPEETDADRRASAADRAQNDRRAAAGPPEKA